MELPLAMSKFASLASSLGPSKVSTQIQPVAGFVQEARPPPPPPPPPPPRKKPVAAPVAAPVPVPAPAIKQSFVEKDDYMVPVCSPGNSFLLIVLHILNPDISVQKQEDVCKALAALKKTLAADLTNERNLYKDFGFRKKRNLTVEALKEMIAAENSDRDTGLPPELAAYCSKYIERNITIVRINGTLERADYECGKEKKPWLLIKEVHNGGYMLYTGTDTVANVIEKELVAGGYTDKKALSKKSQQNKLAKFIKISVEELCARYDLKR